MINWRDRRPGETLSEYDERIKQTEEDLSRLYKYQGKTTGTLLNFTFKLFDSKWTHHTEPDECDPETGRLI